MKKEIFIDNIRWLCGHGGVYPMKARKGKYIPGNVYNQMKEVFIKYCKYKRLLILYSS